MGGLFAGTGILMFIWTLFSCLGRDADFISFAYLAACFVSVFIFTGMFKKIFKTVNMIILYMYGILNMIGFCLNFGADLTGKASLHLLFDYSVSMIFFLVIFLVTRYSSLMNSGFVAAIFAAGSILMLAAARLVGDRINGTYNWIGPLQPSEFIKLAIPVISAWCLKPNVGSKLKIIGNSSMIPMRHFVFLALMVGIIGLMGAINREFGTAMIIAITMVVCFLCMSSSWFWKILLSFLGAAISLVLILSINLLNDRILIWVDFFGEGSKLPNAEVFVRFFRLVNTTGWYGGGLTSAATANIGERYSDFAFMTAVQAGGIILGLAITGVFVVILICGIKIASHQKEQESLIVFTSLCIFSVSAFIHIGGNLTSLPLTGICLPGISNGTQASLCNAGLLAFILAYSGRRVRVLNADTEG
ncbi:MAG: FtsW/RodA/SpoVE family cell cycle protein [Clostridia bacterium]|nr:FtsW/RodA/SpoVE family cell cycle protein [Clostridia bacterium]